MKRYLKVRSVNQRTFFIDEIENVKMMDLVYDSFPGENDGYIISVVEMTEDEFNSLSEFSGF